MILQALNEYYQAMNALGKIAPFGMEWKSLPFIIVISPEGEYVDFVDTRDKGENKLGRRYLVAKTKGRSGSKSYETSQVLWDHSGYVLGIPTEQDANKVEMAPKQHEAFKRELKELCETFPENKEFRAIQLFYDKGQHLALPQEAIEAISKKVGANISFRLSTENDLNRLIASHLDIASYVGGPSSTSSNSDPIGRCLVTGERAPIARLHGGVSLFGAQPGANLISFQKGSGYDSYGKEQGLNAPISVASSDAISTALNHLLLADSNTNYRIGDTTFVFWSTLHQDSLLECYKKATFNGIETSRNDADDEEDDEDTPKRPRRKASSKPQGLDPELEAHKVLSALKSIRGNKGAHIDRKSQDQFYILGLTPNAKRISVKLWQQGSVQEIVSNTLKHLEDMNIVRFGGLVDNEHPRLRSLYTVMKAVSSSNKSDKWSALMIQGIVESIVKGRPYPEALQLACLERILHDHSTSSPVSELRAAILKAYINRKYNYERITMALDKTNAEPAYLAGRLFAVLEGIQKAAIKQANATITDRYYRTASSTPGIIFGRLTQLSVHHLSKIDKEKPGLAYLFRKEIEQIYSLLPGGTARFPKYLNPDEQSIFAAGYYHQRNTSLKNEKGDLQEQEMLETAN